MGKFSFKEIYMRQIGRRSLMAGALGMGTAAMADSQTESKITPRARPKSQDLDRAVLLRC